MPLWGLSILRANLASTEKSAAGKVGLTLPRLNSRLNLNLCIFMHCTCHVTSSTSCVWLKGWFDPLSLPQSIAISRTPSFLGLTVTLNQQMHKQHTCVVCKRAYSLCRHLCLCSDAISKKMRDALKKNIQRTTSKSAQTWVLLIET